MHPLYPGPIASKLNRWPSSIRSMGKIDWRTQALTPKGQIGQ
jgi:hypothetical protein